MSEISARASRRALSAGSWERNGLTGRPAGLGCGERPGAAAAGGLGAAGVAAGAAGAAAAGICGAGAVGCGEGTEEVEGPPAAVRCGPAWAATERAGGADSRRT